MVVRSTGRTGKWAIPALVSLLCLVGAATRVQAESDTHICYFAPTLQQANTCAEQQWRRSDTSLQGLYSGVLSALSEHERPALRQDQAAWQRQRSLHCTQLRRAVQALPQWPRLYYECLMEQNRQRRSVLMHWLHHGEKPL